MNPLCDAALCRSTPIHHMPDSYTKRELVGARPLHLAYARPFGRLKVPLGLSLLRFAAQTRTTLFLLCTKSYIVWRKIGVWRSFRWKSIKRKSLKLLVVSRSFRLCYLKIGNLLLNRLHRGDTFRNRLTMIRDASQSRFYLHSRYSQSFVIRRHSRSFAVNLLSLEEFCCQTKRSVRALLCCFKKYPV